jgi:hypothetical protein
MAKWIRNLYPYYSNTHGWGSHLTIMVLAEMLRAAGFTLNSDNGHAAWTSSSNIIIDDAGGGGVGTGFQVDANKPLEVYDTQGRFTQVMVDTPYMLTLFGGLGGYDNNQSCWRIKRFIDANRVHIDPQGFNPNGWSTDTQLAGRVVHIQGTELSNGSWAIFDSPAGSRYQKY